MAAALGAFALREIMIDKEKILQIVRQKGPVLPVVLTTEMRLNTLLASAVLSEFVREKKIFVSNTKIGGSPVYYVEEQKPLLQNLYKYLNEKDRATFDLLKQSIVLKHTDQEPLTRVSLSNIKDFALPIEVIYRDQKELFWKWYVATDAEVKATIETILKRAPPVTVPPLPLPAAVAPPSPGAGISGVSVLPHSVPLQLPVPETKEIDEKHEKCQRRVVQPRVKTVKEKPLVEPESGKLSPPSPVSLLSSNVSVETDPFHQKLSNFFKQHTLVATLTTVKKKNAELEYHVQVPTPLGVVEYLCVAYNKKKCTETDMMNAFMLGQMKKFPVLVLTTGEITKKAQAKVNEYKNLKLMRVVL